MNPGLFTLEDANEMITEIKRLHSEERLMQVAQSSAYSYMLTKQY